jgi:hypothetical protein
LTERACAGENRQALLDEILAIALDLDLSDDEVGGLVRNRIGMERMRAAWAARREHLPRPEDLSDHHPKPSRERLDIHSASVSTRRLSSGQFITADGEAGTVTRAPERIRSISIAHMGGWQLVIGRPEFSIGCR